MHPQLIIITSVISISYAAIFERRNELNDENQFKVAITNKKEENIEKQTVINIKVNELKQEALAFEKPNKKQAIDDVLKSGDAINYNFRAGKDTRTKRIADEVYVDKDGTTSSVDRINAGVIFDHDLTDEEPPEYRRVRREDEVQYIMDNCPGKQVYKFFDGTLYCTEDDGGPYIIEISERLSFGSIKCTSKQKRIQFNKKTVCVDKISAQNVPPSH